MPGRSCNAVVDLHTMMRRYPASCPDIPSYVAIGSIMWHVARPPNRNRMSSEKVDAGKGGATGDLLDEYRFN